MARRKLVEKIRQGNVLISDGAWGTTLITRGLQVSECAEDWCLSHPEEVFAIAQGYIQAGAQVIETNSFGANRFKLAHYGLEKKVMQINEQAAALSRKAAGEDHYVMGSVGPTGKILMMGDVSEDEIYQVFAEQMIGLEKGSADCVCIETMSALDEACLAIKAAQKNTNLEIVCSFTFEKTINGEYRTVMGVSPSQMALAVHEAGADIVGTNCGNGSAQMIEIVREIRDALPKVPILVRANAGTPFIENNRVIYPEGPETMAENIPALLKAGANIVGGCCGTTPDHIRAIGEMVRKYRETYAKV